LTTLALAVAKISLRIRTFKMGHVTLNTPLLRMIFRRMLGLDIPIGV